MVLPQAALWSLVSAPVSAVAAVLVWQRARTPGRLRPALVLTIAACLLHGVAMTVGLASMAG